MKSKNHTLLLGTLLHLMLLVGACILTVGMSADEVHERPAMANTELTAEEHLLWDKVTHGWYLHEFKGRCLKKAGFKQDCHDCGNVGVEVQLTVDPNGNITEMLEVSSNIGCSKRSESERNQVKDCILESFKDENLPDPFRNRTFHVYLGQSTLC